MNNMRDTPQSLAAHIESLPEFPRQREVASFLRLGNKAAVGRALDEFLVADPYGSQPMQFPGGTVGIQYGTMSDLNEAHPLRGLKERIRDRWSRMPE